MLKVRRREITLLLTQSKKNIDTAERGEQKSKVHDPYYERWEIYFQSGLTPLFSNISVTLCSSNLLMEETEVYQWKSRGLLEVIDPLYNIKYNELITWSDVVINTHLQFSACFITLFKQPLSHSFCWYLPLLYIAKVGVKHESINQSFIIFFAEFHMSILVKVFFYRFIYFNANWKSCSVQFPLKNNH